MKIDELKSHLKKGEIYRRADLANWSKSIDRHLNQLVANGTLQKLAPGMYYVPKETVFGQTPPNEDTLICRFLNDDRFLLTSPNSYNSLGVGTTQLYNKRIVYNHKRHGEFKLGNRNFLFRKKLHFPRKLTQEFLVVDLLNNLNTLAEDQDHVLKNVFTKISTMNADKLKQAISAYGRVKTKKLLEPLVYGTEKSEKGQTSA